LEAVLTRIVGAFSRIHAARTGKDGAWSRMDGGFTGFVAAFDRIKAG
jgi:hypothetical protein